MKLFLIGALAFGSALTLQAQTWDGGSPSINYWSIAANWNPDVVPANNGTAALVFTGTNRLSSYADTNWSINSLTFASFSGSNAFTIDGNTLTIGAGGVTNNDADTNTITNYIILGASQTWSSAAGNLTFTGYSLTFGGNTLTIDGANTTTLGGSGYVTGTGGIVKNGSGTLVLTQYSGPTGPTIVNSGTLALNNSFTTVIGGNLIVGDGSGGNNADVVRFNGNSLISTSGTVTINNSGLLDLNGFSETIGPLVMTGGNIAGNGFLTLNSNVTTNAYTAAATISGTFGLGFTTRTLTIADGSAAADLEISAAITNGGFIKDGAGTLVLSGSFANTTTSTFTVNSGTLSLAKSGSTAAVTGALTIGDALGGANADVVRFDGNNQLADSADVTVTTSGLLSVNGFSDIMDVLTVNGGNVAMTSGTLTVGIVSLASGTIATGSGMLVLGSNINTVASGTTAVIAGNVDLGAGARSFTVSDGTAAVDLAISAAISGTSVLTKNGLGTLVLSGSNAFTGGLTLSSGTLTVGSGNALGTGTLSLAAGSIQADAVPRTVTNAVALSGNATISGTGLTFSGPMTLTGNRILTIDNAAVTTFFGGIGEDLAGRTFTKSGTGTLVLAGSGTNTYTGATTVSAGLLVLSKSAPAAAITGSLIVGDSLGGGGADIVRFDGNDQLGAGLVTVSISGLLNLNGFAESLNDLTVSGGVVTTGSGTLAVTNLIMSGGTIASSGGLLALAGDVTTNASGTSAVLSGDVSLSGTGHTFTVANGTAVNDFDVVAAVTNGAMTKQGTGTLRLAGSNSFAGGVVVAAGALALGSDTGAGTGLLTLSGGTVQTDGAPRTIANALALAASSTIGGAADLTFSNVTTLTGNALLTISNTGTTTFAGGLATFASTSVLTGARLNVGGSGLDNSGAFTLAGGTLDGTAVLTNNASLSGFGSIEGTGGFINNGLITQGAGNLLFSNSNSHVNNGNIDLVAGRQLRLTSAPLSNKGTIDLNGGIISGTGSLLNFLGGLITGRGTISSPFANNGGTLRPQGGTVNIASAFSNSGLIDVSTGGALNGGALSNIGRIQGSGSIGNAINNDGRIEAAGGTLALSGALTNNATGTIAAPSAVTVLVTSGLATNAGAISLGGGSFDNNGFALNNTGQIFGYGSISTGGFVNNGQVTFTGGIATINGPVTNQSGREIRVAHNPAVFTGNVVNYGTFKSDSTAVTFGGTFTNNGAFLSDPAVQNFNHLVIGSPGYLVGGAGDVFNISGDLLSHSAQPGSWETSAAKFSLLGTGTHTLAWTGADLGPLYAGYGNNFAIGEFVLGGGASLTLLDGDAFFGGALYVKTLTLGGGLAQIEAITGNGINIFYDPAAPGNSYLARQTYPLRNGGFIAGIPEPGTATMLGAGLVLLAVTIRSRRR